MKLPHEVLEEIKEYLNKEQDRIDAQIKDLSAQDPFTDVTRVNDNAASDMEASEESDHERLQALILELKARRSAVEAAVKRIADGSYGFCENCKKLIDTDRLAAMPTATLCIDCQAKKTK